MVIVNLKGGLGNQMFQFALGYSISKRMKTKCIYDVVSFKYDQLRNYELDVFNLSLEFANEKQINAVKSSNSSLKDRINSKIFKINIPYYRRSIVLETNFSFDSNLTKIKKDCYLDGYFQSERYFIEYRKELLNLFQFKNSPNSYYATLFDSIKDKESVSIHIRRGDYVSNNDANSFHGLTSLTYYKNAIKKMSELISNPFFIVISDDIEWCKTEFNFVDCLFVENGKGQDYEDLRLMLSCKNNIIANSSFSWWGAWLNQNPNKIVISPKIWFLNEEFQSQTHDLKPSEWIQL